MDSKEFVRKFEEKVKLAKEGDAERRKELDGLKEKLISNIQEEFLDSIPEQIDKEFFVLSEYIRVRYEKGNYVINNLKFKDYARVKKFVNEIAQYLSEILGRNVEAQSFKHELGFDVRLLIVI